MQTVKVFHPNAEKVFGEEDVVSSKRKRVLLVNDYKNAFKRKNIYSVFQKLSQVLWHYPAQSTRNLTQALDEICSRYEVCHKPAPKFAKEKV